MKILPAIDLRHGKVVQLVGGDPAQVAVEAAVAPEAQAIKWREAGADMLHVVDLDGAFGETRQWPAVSKILRTGAKVQFGGGVRSMLDVQKLLELGVSHVIVGTQGVQEPEWLRELATLFPYRIVLAVDALGRDVVVKGWTEKTGLDVVELARAVDDARLAGILYTNVEKEGRLQGIDAEVVRDLVDASANTPLIVSGGISDQDDLQTLAELGVDAVVLGMSIYTGAIDLKAAIDAHGVPA